MAYRALPDGRGERYCCGESSLTGIAYTLLLGGSSRIFPGGRRGTPSIFKTQDGGPGSGGHSPILAAKSPMGRSIRTAIGHVGRILIPTQAHPLPCRLACWCVPFLGGAVRDWRLQGLAEMGIDRGEMECRKGHRERRLTEREVSWPASPRPGRLPHGALGMRRLDGQQVPARPETTSMARLLAAPAASPASRPSSTPVTSPRGAWGFFGVHGQY